MSKKEIGIKYITLLEAGDVDNIIKLFSEQGKVTSPIYGTSNAKGFYEKLKEDTNKSILKLNGVFEDNDTNRIAIYFNYRWTLKNNSQVEFDVVDILEFNNDLKIEHLHIIYDTSKSRELVNKLNSN